MTSLQGRSVRREEVVALVMVSGQLVLKGVDGLVDLRNIR